MVNKGQQVHFQYYRDNELWYVTDSGFTFPVPAKDVGTATFLRDDKAILFMRYIRMYREEMQKETESTQSACAAS
jgi:hypothetical protein